MNRKERNYQHRYKMNIITALLVLNVIIVSMQLWLFIATVNAYLGADYSIVLPSLLASGACFLMCFATLYFIRR